MKVYVVQGSKEGRVHGIFENIEAAQACQKIREGRIDEYETDVECKEYKVFTCRLNMTSGDSFIDAPDILTTRVHQEPDFAEILKARALPRDRWERLHFRITAGTTLGVAVWLESWRAAKLSEVRHAGLKVTIVGDRMELVRDYK